MIDPELLIDMERRAIDVMQRNDMGTYTMADQGIHDHAWLWDGAFAADGWRHLDVQRAAQEIKYLFHGQWQNGMVPNTILRNGHLPKGLGDRYKDLAGRNVPAMDALFHASRFRNYGNVPRGVGTSGISQPPVLAESIQKVGEKMDHEDRRAFYGAMIGPLVTYHNWIYTDRNYGKDDLFAAVHPWETGMDNTPPWVEHMKSIDWGKSAPLIKVAVRRLQHMRPDATHNLSERSSVDENVMQAICEIALIRKGYNAKRLADGHPVHVQDILLNSALIRNNHVLRELAAEITIPLSDELQSHMVGTEASLDKLWDEADGLYYSRDAISGKLLKIPTIASLMPLYGGLLPAERAERLIGHLTDPASFGIQHGIPSVPVNSPFYQPHRYWQGPAWIQTNWLLAEGAGRLGYPAVKRQIRDNSLGTIAIGGMHEFFGPEGKGLGVDNFTMTAALTLDFVDHIRQDT